MFVVVLVVGESAVGFKEEGGEEEMAERGRVTRLRASWGSWGVECEFWIWGTGGI